MKTNKYLLILYSTLLIFFSGFKIYERISDLDEIDFIVLNYLFKPTVIIVFVSFYLGKFIKNRLELDTISINSIIFTALFLILTSDLYLDLYFIFHPDFLNVFELINIFEIFSIIFSILILVILINQYKRTKKILKYLYLSTSVITIYLLLDYLYISIFYLPVFFDEFSNINYVYIFSITEFIYISLSIVISLTAFLLYKLISYQKDDISKNLNIVLFLSSLFLLMYVLIAEFNYFMEIYFYNYYIICVLSVIIVFKDKNNIDKIVNSYKKDETIEELFK